MKSPSQPASTSRRMAIKQMSFLLFGFSPLVKILGKSLTTPFVIQKKGKTIRFLLDKQVGWEINPDRFGRQATLAYTETEEAVGLTLQNAYYPGSRIRVDFKARIVQHFGRWTLDIRFPHLNINQRVPFVSWLRGLTSLTGHMQQAQSLQLGKTDQLNIGTASLTLNNHWETELKPDNPVVLQLLSNQQQYQSIRISIDRPAVAYWLSDHRFNQTSWIVLENPQTDFNTFSSLRYQEKPIITTQSYPFETTGILLARNEREPVTMLFASNEKPGSSQISYTPVTDGSARLTLYKSRFIREYTQTGEPFALVADLGDQPQWFGTAGTAVALTGSKNAIFQLSGENDAIDYIDCQALLVESMLAIEGGRSLPVSYADPSIVNVLPQDPVKKTKTVKPGEVQTTGAIERLTPQERVNWIYVNKEPFKVNMKIDKPILFNVLRPQDFLNLQFEFVNFNLDGHLLKVDNQKQPAFLMVHFPSQHLREEAIRAGDPLHIPVRFKRAGNSRLVFKVPSDYPPIPLTLNNLLNWNDFSLQVNYRARWFNTSGISSLIHEQLSAISMVFSSRKTTAPLRIKGAPVQLQSRPVKSIATQQKAVAAAARPLSALEVKAAMATTPKGPGIMALTDNQLMGVVANPEIELSTTDAIRGAMTHLFAIQPPSLFETSIEAPTYAEVSPNQFAGFNHSIELKDEFGEFDETAEDGFHISDEPAITPIQPVQPTRRIVTRGTSGTIKPIQKAPQTKTVSGITVAVPAVRSYKHLVSPVVLKLPSNLVFEQGQLFELWHSRMGIRLASGEVDESALSSLKTVRVLWSAWAGSRIQEKPGRSQDNIPFNAPDPEDFHNLVHSTSNFTDLQDEKTNIKINPQPVKAHQLILSSLGAWFNYEYHAKTDIKHIPLVAWLHRATMGRDQFIKVINRGFLFPFGHKAVLIQVSERQIKMVNNMATAVMIYRSFIQVKQPELFYGKEQNSEFIPFPFQRVEIKDREKEIYEVQLGGGKFIELNKVSSTSQPDPFKIEVDDASGMKINMEVPLVFVYGGEPAYNFVVDHYQNQGWDYFTSSSPHRPVAYARSLVPGDTTFETHNILFSARVINNFINDINFYPEIRESSIYIRQMEELTGERKPVRIELIDDNNLSMVFAKVAEGENAALVFGNSEKSGGLITPNMAVSGLSKLTGLTGNTIDNLNQLVVQINEIFSLADKLPKLFGIINFVDLLVPDVDLSGAIGNIKETIEQVRSQIEDLQQQVMSVLARIDTELKKLNLFLQIIGNLLDETDIIGALQDIPKLAQAFQAFGVSVPGNLEEAITGTITVGKAIKEKSVEIETILPYLSNSQGFKNKLTEAGITVTASLSQSVDQMMPLAQSLNNKGLPEGEIIAVIGGMGLAGQLGDIQGIIKTLATQVADQVLQAIPEIPNVKFQIKGNELTIEYHWKPKTKEEYSLGDLFAIKNLKEGNKQIDVSVDSIMTKTIDLTNPPAFDIRASVNEFTLTIAQSIQLNLKKVEFKAGMSAKPDVDVKFQAVPIRLIGALSFVNSLQSVIKSDQFDSGPFIDITANGIVAGYNFPIPNLEVGIFALSNMMLGVKITLPFTNDPFKFGFNFCTRENPFKLMVSCFGGGGFFLMETTMQGLTRLEAAFEFGAGMSLNVGVASGSVEVMGGFYYTLVTETTADGTFQTQSFTAYLRMTGRLSIIGLIKVTLEFYLELRYEELGQKTTAEGLKIAAGSRLVGTATLSVKVEILFFSKTVKVTVSRTLAGNDADPKFEQTYKPEHWQLYCAAFAS